jgi:glycosyltransferase involved in cell wall biosynthesis
MRFSVIIPVYNRDQRMHRQAIDSVLAQSFTDYELVVVDDGSTDDTAAILASYGSRISVVRQPNQGAEIARHTAALQSKGEYLVFLDSDDLLCRAALSTYDRVIEECGSPPLVIGAWIPFVDGQTIPRDVETEKEDVLVSVYADFLSRNLTMGLSNSLIVIRKSLLQEIGPRSPSSPQLLLDDFHMCLRAGTRGPCVVVREPVTVAYRLHDHNAHLDGGANVRAILSLVKSERAGIYPGSLPRQKDRYRWIGSIGLYWIRRWLKGGRMDFVFAVLVDAFPMLVTATLYKIKRWGGSSAAEPVRVLRSPRQSVAASVGDPI